MKELKQSEEKPILLVSNPYVTDSSLSSSKPLPFRPDQNNDHNVVGQGDVSLVLENPGGQESQSESFLRVKDDFVHQQESSEETEVESDHHQHQHRHEDAVDGESFVIDFPSGGGFSSNVDPIQGRFFPKGFLFHASDISKGRDFTILL